MFAAEHALLAEELINYRLKERSGRLFAQKCRISAQHQSAAEVLHFQTQLLKSRMLFQYQRCLTGTELYRFRNEGRCLSSRPNVTALATARSGCVHAGYADRSTAPRRAALPRPSKNPALTRRCAASSCGPKGRVYSPATRGRLPSTALRISVRASRRSFSTPSSAAG